MFALFKFRLPTAVTEQLIAKLDGLKATKLSSEALKKLKKFEDKLDSRSGVYVIFENSQAVYAGKANKLHERLSRHFKNLSGRKGVTMDAITYKALFLDENWSASANEALLIKHFKNLQLCTWNGKGFGPKDTGEERDDSLPNWFDRTYPINELWPVETAQLVGKAGEVLEKIKASLPYLLRFDLQPDDGDKQIDARTAEPTMRSVMIHIAKELGDGYQLTLFNNRVTLYPGAKNFKHGTQLYPEVVGKAGA